MMLAYEAVLKRPDNLRAVRALVTDVDGFCLRDPADEMVLDAAVCGGAEVIVTFNRRNFLPGARRFGIEVLTPAEALGRL